MGEGVLGGSVGLQGGEADGEGMRPWAEGLSADPPTENRTSRSGSGWA